MKHVCRNSGLVPIRPITVSRLVPEASTYAEPQGGQSGFVCLCRRTAIVFSCDNHCCLLLFHSPGKSFVTSFHFTHTHSCLTPSHRDALYPLCLAHKQLSNSQKPVAFQNPPAYPWTYSKIDDQKPSTSLRAFGFATHKADDTHFLSSSVPFTKACHNSHCWPIVRPRIIQRRPPISLTSASDNHHLDFPTGTSINLINYSTTTTSTRIFGLQSSHERLLHHYKAGSLFLLSGFD